MSIKFLNYYIIRLSVFWCLSLNCSCSRASDKSAYVGCTPGDSLIKYTLGIPNESVVDFIKWDLIFDSLYPNSFALYIIYGESQANTLGFKNGGKRKVYQGEYRILNDAGKEIYQLTSSGFQTKILIVKLNPNIFHLLSPEMQLMVGNGGWSYTLNNRSPDKNIYPLPKLTNSKNILKDTALEVIYDGRTPCQDFAAENKLTVDTSCFKLKWKLILKRDPQTFQPTEYLLHRTNSRESDISGNWKISKGEPTNMDAIIIQLDPDKPSQTISLLVGDGNVLFFLSKDKGLFIGNDNFSFTLNKRQSQRN